MKKVVNTFARLLGIADGEFAYRGPRCVQIDLTNRCNNDCIGCWCNSPLLEEQRLPSYITNATLQRERVLSLLDELRAMGTQELFFAGGGEPFMHPHALEIFSHAKQRGFHVTVNTNFTLVDQNMAKELVDIKLDHLIVSVWAGSPDVYVRTHPNKTAAHFTHVYETLKWLQTYKTRKGAPPVIKVYHVLLKENVHDFENMIRFVQETGAESVECTVIDTIPGKTDRLQLSKDDARGLYERAKKVREYYAQDTAVYLANYETFLRRLEGIFIHAGNYDTALVQDVPCYAGWTFARIIANGDVNSCLKSHRIPIGNIEKSSFRSLWNNARQRAFRKHTRNIEPENPYFRFIGNDPQGTCGCYRSCDNRGHSLLLHTQLQRVPVWARTLFHVLGKSTNRARSLWTKN